MRARGTATRNEKRTGRGPSVSCCCMRATRAAVGGRVAWVEGSHLFPMERPEEAARAVVTMLDAMAVPMHDTRAA